MQQNDTGKLGEEIAVNYLIQNGYTVLERNRRLGHLETDIIARDDHFLIFAEVKTRTCLYPGSSLYGRPAGAVDRNKRGHLLSAARGYLRAHPDTGLQPRMDVIEVYLDAKHPTTVLKVHHIRNAFPAH